MRCDPSVDVHLEYWEMCQYYMMYFFISCRVTHSSDPEAFHGLFEYMDNNGIMKDKTHMWECIQAVTEKAFKLFLEVRAEKVYNGFNQKYGYIYYSLLYLIKQVAHLFLPDFNQKVSYMILRNLIPAVLILS